MIESDVFKELRVIPGKSNPPIRRSRYPFLYESFRVAGLKKLRKRYQLDSLTSAGATDWDVMRSVRDWLRGRWDHGYHNTTNGTSSSGLDYLLRSERGESFTCAVFAITLVEALVSLGIPARNLTIGRGPSDFVGPYDEVGHCITEAWSNHFRKWIVLDADAGAHYEESGIPLSALEIRQAWLEGRWKKLDFVRAPRLPQIRYETFNGSKSHLAKGFRDFYRYNVINFYQHLIYQMSNRHFTGARITRYITWFDDCIPPRIVRHNTIVRASDYTITDTRDDVEYSLNHVHLRVLCVDNAERKPSRELQVHAESETPWFSHYEIKIDRGHGGKLPIHSHGIVTKAKIYLRSVRSMRSDALGLKAQSQ